MIEISIIIPVYNVEKTISSCLNSILNQIKQVSYEIIIIDDGSTDDTKNIIQSYKKRYPEIIYAWQENQKQSAARNLGLDMSTGKYIFFFDGDDLVSDGMICKMYSAINNNDAHDLVICGIKKVFCKKNDVISEKIELNSYLNDNVSIIPTYLIHSKELDVGLWNKIFKRSIIEQNQIRFNNGNFFEDSLFVLHYILSSNKKIIYLNQPLYSLFKRQGSTTCQYNPDIVHYALSYTKETLKLCNNFDVTLSQSIINSFILRTYLHIIHHNIKNNSNFNKIERKKIKRIFEIKNSMMINNRLTVSYKAALVCYNFFPKLYSKLYQRFMPS